jgi:hypothetical protein
VSAGNHRYVIRAENPFLYGTPVPRAEIEPTFAQTLVTCVVCLCVTHERAFWYRSPYFELILF